MQKTIAELKRNANSGRMCLEMLKWHEAEGDQIPERLRGVRPVLRANTVALILKNNNGHESELRIPAASLMEYDGENLVVYDPGVRPLNDAEQKVLDRVAEIYKAHENTYNGGFWQVKAYVKDSPCPWMDGHETVKGKRYQPWNKTVRDSAIKGEVILKYRVYWH